MPTKGHGAGGSNTNKNGLPYELLTDLESEYTTISYGSFHHVIRFESCNKQYNRTEKSNFSKYMRDKCDPTVCPAHGCKSPDECYIDECKKTVFIIEKKFQQVSGSVCEKIQTPDFKIWQYSRLYPNYTIVYIYCLSDWFKYNCKSEIEYLDYKKIPFFWGSDNQYKSNIVKFITSYEL